MTKQRHTFARVMPNDFAFTCEHCGFKKEYRNEKARSKFTKLHLKHVHGLEGEHVLEPIQRNDVIVRNELNGRKNIVRNPRALE